MKLGMLAAVLAAAVGAAGLALTSGCVRCQVGSTKCDGNAAYTCLSNGFWRKSMSCDQVGIQSGKPFACCNVQRKNGELGSTCLPAEECK